MGWRTAVLAAFIAGAVSPGVAMAAPCDNPSPVKFPTGSSQTEIAGGLARGDRACWTLDARHGQRMVIRQQNGKDSNIAIQIYRPGWSLVHSSEGIRVQGRALPGAAEGKDARNWSGTLPATGIYLLVLGTTWGGGSYRIRIEIR